MARGSLSWVGHTRSHLLYIWVLGTSSPALMGRAKQESKNTPVVVNVGSVRETVTSRKGSTRIRLFYQPSIVTQGPKGSLPFFPVLGFRRHKRLRPSLRVLSRPDGPPLSASLRFSFPTPTAVLSGDGNIIICRAIPSEQTCCVCVCGRDSGRYIPMLSPSPTASPRCSRQATRARQPAQHRPPRAHHPDVQTPRDK
jgi:hypothetical protein